MNKLFASLLLTLTLFSCQKEEVIKSESFPQTWQLVKLVGQVPNSSVTGTIGTELPWQETYVFNADSTFTKTRQQGNQATKASGTFSFQKFSDDRPYVVLTYESANNLIASCTTIELKETLAFKTEDILIGTWLFCDGPGLEYVKVK